MIEKFMNVDYSKYSIEELLQAAQSIDPEKNPVNYQKLKAEYERRKDEIDEKVSEEAEAEKDNTFEKVKLAGYLQLTGGFIFILFAIISYQNLITLSASIVLGMLSIFAGKLLLQSHELGYDLTYINQGLQLISLKIGGVVFNYAALGGVYFELTTDGSLGFNAVFNPSITLAYGSSANDGFIAIDLLAIAIIYLVGMKRSFVETEQG
ncbi:hypothetical protein [Microbulbifer spongiae]|uniref:DUF2157 domain-containing protein n=1 Tax=Microbulbifer spongiae TaxID=2944933 RepID=A0ABY9EA26_9GAMM|nr:hypothetical protein [Microbulbifer sp. MI-G]WKD49853.1 hypothetical protein M8T91_00040 [Microbulbifer sp. MI-G]